MSDDELLRAIADLARKQAEQAAAPDEELPPLDAAAHARALSLALAGLAEADDGPDDALWLADAHADDGLGAEETAEVPAELDEGPADASVDEPGLPAIPADVERVAAEARVEEEVLAEVVDFQAARDRRAALTERRQVAAPEPEPRLRGGWLGWAGLAAAVLAVVLLSRPQHEPLGAYELSVLEAPKVVRGGDDALQLRVGERFTLLARPAEEVGGGLHATLWLVGDGHWLRLPAVVEVSEQGAVRLQAELIDTPLRGEAELVVTVGRTEAASHEAGAATDSEHLRVLRLPVVVRAPR